MNRGNSIIPAPGRLRIDKGNSIPRQTLGCEAKSISRIIRILTCRAYANIGRNGDAD